MGRVYLSVGPDLVTHIVPIWRPIVLRNLLPRIADEVAADVLAFGCHVLPGLICRSNGRPSESRQQPRPTVAALTGQAVVAGRVLWRQREEPRVWDGARVLAQVGSAAVPGLADDQQRSVAFRGEKSGQGAHPRVAEHDAASGTGAGHGHLHPKRFILLTRNRVAIASV